MKSKASAGMSFDALMRVVDDVFHSSEHKSVDVKLDVIQKLLVAILRELRGE
jgi:hypothetical protein